MAGRTCSDADQNEPGSDSPGHPGLRLTPRVRIGLKPPGRLACACSRVRFLLLPESDSEPNKLAWRAGTGAAPDPRAAAAVGCEVRRFAFAQTSIGRREALRTEEDTNGGEHAGDIVTSSSISCQTPLASCDQESSLVSSALTIGAGGSTWEPRGDGGPTK